MTVTREPRDKIGLTTDRKVKTRGVSFLAAVLVDRSLYWWPNMPLVHGGLEMDRHHNRMAVFVEQLAAYKAHPKPMRADTFGKEKVEYSGKSSGVKDDIATAGICAFYYMNDTLINTGLKNLGL